MLRISESVGRVDSWFGAFAVFANVPTEGSKFPLRAFFFRRSIDDPKIFRRNNAECGPISDYPRKKKRAGYREEEKVYFWKNMKEDSGKKIEEYRSRFLEEDVSRYTSVVPFIRVKVAQFM